MGAKEDMHWECVRSDLEKGEVVYMRYARWSIVSFMEQFHIMIKHVGDRIETIELDIENVKDREGEMFGDFTLSVIPKLKLDLVSFDLLTWLSVSENEEKYNGHNDTMVYMRWLMMGDCHIEKDGDELLPIVHVDKEAYTDSEYHIITNYLEYLGIETEDLKK